MIQSSLYFHIPYCKQACTYCDFHFSTNTATKEGVLHQMNAEMKMRGLRTPWNSLQVKSLYFGGGTPSILSYNEIEGLIKSARNYFALAKNIEVTLEANPDDITAEKLEQWYEIGINRLSVGIQSFSDSELKACNRAHDSETAHEALRLINASSINNFSIDLIYGMVDSTVQSWYDNLATALSYAPNHISCYSLTVEEKTALAHQVNTGLVTLPEDDVVVAQFEYLRQWANKYGYDHYELSNFCKPGQQSHHNKHYWSYQPYLGIGPGAHSFDGAKRFWNVNNNKRYINSAPLEAETLSISEQINERLMVRLRTSEGFRYQRDLPKDIPIRIKTQLLKNVDNAMSRGDLFPLPDGYKILPEKWMRSDHIITNLFVDPES